MRRLAYAAALGLMFAAGMASAQMTRSAAEEAGKELGREVRDEHKDVVSDEASPGQVPGYAGADLPEGALFDNPDQLTAQGETAAYSDPYIAVITDPARPYFDPTTIDMERGLAIEQTPEEFLGTGLDVNGSANACEPLPPGAGSDSFYLETCNEGQEVYDETRRCNPVVATAIEQVPTDYKYFVAADDVFGANYARTYVFANEVSRGICRYTGRVVQGCAADREVGRAPGAYCQNFSVRELVCSSEVTGIYQDCQRNFPGQCTSATWIMGNGEYWFARNYRTEVTAARSDTACHALESDAACVFQPQEVCLEGPETRIVEGQSITQSCWRWERTYQCHGIRPANDCGALDARAECSFDHDQCLDDPQEGACKVYDRVYKCRSAEATPADAAYICAGDLYCINGECSVVEREASTEFKDAMVAVQTLGEIQAGFNPDDLTLFTGEKEACTRKLFGLSNCCSGKGVPLLTPWLCSAADRDVDKKDDAGLCHQVGTYCSASVLGVCTTKKQSYCCFASKLTRILQEQGRAQIGKPWGKPKTPNCAGFQVAEFQSLDLSRMDFSEVYSEFVEAARVPDEIETTLELQQRIEEYYALHAPSS